jgi:hypothetical protein
MKTGIEIRLSDEPVRRAFALSPYRPRIDKERAFFWGGGHIFMIDLARRGRP